MDLSSYEKVEKMKKRPKSVKPSVLYNDDNDLENNAHECGKGKILKSKQKKKHKKRLDVNASSSIFDEDSCMDVSISQKGSQQKVQYTTEAMSLANDFPVTKKHSAQLSECEESTNMDPTDVLPKGKRKKKRVIKSSQNKLTLDDPFPILGKDECMLFSGGFEVDSDDMLSDTSAKNDTSVPQSSKNKQNLEGALISFTKVKTTPPAFVKRAIKKLSTPKTEPKKPSAKLVNDVVTGSSLSLSKKKVIFAMSKNKAQDFNESLMVSPVIPFDPKQKPDQGILRSSPATTDSPVMKSPRTKLFLKRVKATDFF
ncbi:hypothetical protein LSH36_874g01064 [Paralvinella palmiformis]|uniref:Uncharacterized protein n=1 Tax=Paralvinella palmiformis TaxID=53620 RepID=A0AAD9IZS9_9ANNE|nr:hypothetical protein LSH36_874g01064 [Paralvinella palmiformis]